MSGTMSNNSWIALGEVAPRLGISFKQWMNIPHEPPEKEDEAAMCARQNALIQASKDHFLTYSFMRELDPFSMMIVP